MKPTSFFLIFTFSLVIGCADQDRARQAKFFAFGTEIEVSLYGVDAETANGTVQLLEDSFSNVNDQWHAWKPSILTDINEAIAQSESITISANVERVINQAKKTAQQSNHLFNPAAGKLFELWGYHQDDWFSSRPPPANDIIQAWVISSPTMADIQIVDLQLSSNNPDVKIGFGGFAKGFAVDQAIEALQRQGIENAIVNIGGDLRAIGSHGKRPWNIGIRHPRKKGMLASIDLENDESVFSSGDYERFFEYEGNRYPHILDPRTGYPADQAISVTVLHTNAAQADAAATALFVAGKDWPQLATNMDIEHVMLVRPDGQVELSAAMHKRVHLINNHQAPVIRELPQL